MINNDTVHRVLGSLERFAPAEEAVLAGFREGVVKRRRRRQVASVVGVAAAASLVALGVFLVSPGKGGQPPAPPPAAAPPNTPEVKISPPPPAPALPFTVTGLPGGYQLQAWEVSPTEGSAQFVGTKDFQTIVVWISAEPRDPVQGATEEPTTIAGRPGMIRRLPPDAEQQLIWQLADGRWAMVGGHAPTVSLAALRNVADNLSLTPTPLTTRLVLGVLPGGYQVANWSGAGSVMICRGSAPAGRGHQPADDCVSLTIKEGTAPATEPTKSKTDIVEIPIDQLKVVNGVSTRATADGTTVVAQLDAGHWVQASSRGAGVDLLREVASTSGIK